MTPCPFAIHLMHYEGPIEPLKAHVAKCPDCHAASLIRAACLEEAKRSEECPDHGVLAAYGERLLEDDERAEVRAHIESCNYCQLILIECSGNGERAEEASRALRQGDAYLLAREIALWLSTEKYPREGDRVEQEFDQAYNEAPFDSAAASPQRSLEGALCFAGESGTPLYLRLIGISLLAASIYYKEGAKDLTGRLRAVAADLPLEDLSAGLIETVAKHLEEQSED